MRCRVVTWNVHSCIGADRRHDPARVADVLAALDADVIGLQEVDWRQPELEGRRQFELLAERLRMTAVPGHNLRDRRGAYGNGLLTRFEVSAARRVALPGAREPRGAIDALLRSPDGQLRVLVTHLGLGRLERRRQAQLLRAAVHAAAPAERALPTVLLGDLNEWRPSIASRTPLVPDPFPAVASGRTYPSRFPYFALDRVLARPTPEMLSFEVVRTQQARVASDHLPLVAELAWGADGDGPGSGPSAR